MTEGSPSAAPPEDHAGLHAREFRVLLGLFLLSGAAGLVDQVCFSKYLSYVVGATAYAVSAVLAAFMTGLTIGATLGGRLSARVRRPLVAYGAAELVVAVAVACTPAAFGGLTPLYVSLARGASGSVAMLSAVRWALTLLVVVVPTIAMGATLPLVAAALSPGGPPEAARKVRERRLAWLYAANTSGGAIGSLAGAYVVLPALGLSHTVYAAAAASAVAGVTALSLGSTRSAPVANGPEVTDVAPPAAPARDLRRSARPPAAPPVATSTAWPFVLSFASGALSFTLEVVATHLLAVIVGNSAYAFGLILASFLVCLFLGAALAPRLSLMHGEHALAMSLSFTALALAMTLPLWDDLPLLFRGLGGYVTSFGGREAMRALVSFAILALPATCLGLTFPLLLSWASHQRHVGRLVGQLSAVNTVGAVVGALGTGYVVLPALGSEHTLLAVALTFAALGLATALRRGAPRTAVALALAAVAAGVLGPAWRVDRLTSGNNVYFDTNPTPDEVVSVREDVHGGITTVTKREGVQTLYTNGKFQGNDGWELHAQRFFAHYPCLFVPRFEQALVIGLGTGTTLGTLSSYPWKRMDVVEISPAIVEAAGKYFSGPNGNALQDPRVHLTLDDARNHLLVHEGRYDLIGMELSSVWFAGASSLYSAEYYRLVREHLAPGGIFQQWVQMHHVYRPVFAALVHTLRREFPHVALFYGGGQGILVASEAPLEWSRERARQMTADARVGLTLPDHRSLETLTDDVIAFDDGIDRFLADSAKEAGEPLEELVSTDDNLFLEYRTPRGNVLPWDSREKLVATVRAYRDDAAIAALAR